MTDPVDAARYMIRLAIESGVPLQRIEYVAMEEDKAWSRRKKESELAFERLLLREGKPPKWRAA